MKTLSFTFSIILFISFFSTLNAQNGTLNTLETSISAEDLAIINKNLPPHLNIDPTGQIIQNTARGSAYLLDSSHFFHWDNNWIMIGRDKFISHSPEGYLLEEENQMLNSSTGNIEAHYYKNYSYQTDGRVSQAVTLEWNGVSKDSSIIRNYQYNNDGYITLLEEYSFDLTTAQRVPRFKYVRTYNNLNQIVSNKRYNNSNIDTWELYYQEDYFYNSKSQIEIIINGNWNGATNSWKYIDKYFFFYDMNDEVTHKKSYRLNNSTSVWELQGQTLMAEDSNGNLTRQITQKWSTSNQTWENLRKYIRTYNVNSQQLSRTYEKWINNQWVFQDKDERTYNNNGDKVSIESFYWENGAWQFHIRDITIYDINDKPLRDEYSFYDNNTGSFNISTAKDYFYSLHTTTNTETVLNKPIKVYPNPTTGVVQVDLPLDFSQGQVMIFDMQGKLLKSESYQNNTIDFSVFNNGLYVLQFVNKEKRYSVRIIKN